MADTTVDIFSVEALNYQGAQGSVLKNISFSFPVGGIHGILSPFGGASSTLLQVLAGVWSTDSASVFLEGQTWELSSAAWKQQFGYVPKTPEFYAGMTVYELLEFVGEARGVSSELRLRQMEEALELVSLESVEYRLVERLSVGEKKRLSFAAALLGNPSLLLLDAPTPELFDMIRLLGKHKTVILGSGDFDALQALCDDIVILSDGAVLASGSFADLEAALVQHGEKQSLAQVYASIEALSGEKPQKKSTILNRKNQKEERR